jgi:DNA polymerase elongation subunit (family B)
MKKIVFAVIYLVDGARCGDSNPLSSAGVERKNVCAVASEEDLVHAVVDAVKLHDPDLLVGYEIQLSSWGYLIDRSAAKGINLVPMLSRLPANEKQSAAKEEQVS